MKLIIVTTILTLMLSGCGRTPSNSTSADGMPGKRNFAAECESVGGKWTRGGVGGFYGCLKKAPDAGKACTDDSQCTYNCYAHPADEQRTGMESIGQCQADNRYQGCHSEIRKGIIQPRYCVQI